MLDGHDAIVAVLPWTTIRAVSPSGGRSTLVLNAPAGALGLVFVAFLVGVVIFAMVSSGTNPEATQEVAGRTSAPTAMARATASAGAPEPSQIDEPGASALPTPTVSPTLEPVATLPPGFHTAIVPGEVGRSSLELRATYRVAAAITVRTGVIDVTTRIEVRNESGDGIDRLELNTVAARLGNIRLGGATVDDSPVKVVIRDQTLVVPLGGILPDGATAIVTVAYRATLRGGSGDSDWMFSRAGGTLALYRWIPWVSEAKPFDRPNIGDPFVTPTSPQVDVEILVDEQMVLAAPATEIEVFAAGLGTAWSFTVRDVRDVSVVLAPDFHVTRGEVDGIPVRVYTRPGGLNGAHLLDLASAAIELESRQLGLDYPGPTLVVVETEAGPALESPGLVWIPDDFTPLNRTYAVYHTIAQQWFYGLVGSDQRAEPFAEEAPADLLARTALGTLRASRCPRQALDESINAYSRTCYYEVVFVQGGLLLDELRQRIGTKAFWAAMRGYLEDNRHGIAGTRELLEALRAATDANLLPVLRSRFPDLY